MQMDPVNLVQLRQVCVGGVPHCRIRAAGMVHVRVVSVNKGVPVSLPQTWVESQTQQTVLATFGCHIREGNGWLNLARLRVDPVDPPCGTLSHPLLIEHWII